LPVIPALSTSLEGGTADRGGEESNREDLHVEDGELSEGGRSPRRYE